MGASQAPIIRSRDIAMNTAISMAASSMLEDMRSTPSRWRSIPAAGSSQASPGPSIRGTSSGLPGDRRRREAPGSPSCRARPPQAQRRGGLGRPSLLVGDGYCPACRLSSSHLRRCRVSGGQEVSESQSGAGPCRPAAFSRPSARSRISFGNGRPHAEYAVGKRGNWTGISSVSPVSQTHPTEGD